LKRFDQTISLFHCVLQLENALFQLWDLVDGLEGSACKPPVEGDL
jgi:hypothetical protein